MNRLRRLMGDGRGACGVLSQSTHSGGSGAPPGRHYDRSARSSLDWDRPKAANGRLRPRPRKRGLELSGKGFVPAARAATARRKAPRVSERAA